MGYFRDVIKGISWGSALDAAGKGTSIIKIAILTRVFTPAEFGVFGIAILILGFLELVTETGINVFLVQERDEVKRFLNTAWVISIARGVLISLVLAIFSYPIAIFFKTPQAHNVILAVSLVPFLRGFINPAIVTLQKGLRFKEDAIYRFAISLIGDAAVVIFALLTFSVFSFVWGMIISAAIEIIITFLIVKERPKFKFERQQLVRIVGRGKWVMAAYLFDYFFEHLDDLAVARLLNAFSLGIYQQAYALSIVPLNVLAKQLGRVTFPIYVKFTEDKERIRRAFYKTLAVTFATVLPFGILLFLLSDIAVRLILGDKWLLAIPVLRVLSLFGVIRAITSLFYAVFLAYKKQNYVSIVTLVSILTLGVFIFPLTNMFGITGAAISALIGSIAGLPVAFYLFRKTLRNA